MNKTIPGKLIKSLKEHLARIERGEFADEPVKNFCGFHQCSKCVLFRKASGGGRVLCVVYDLAYTSIRGTTPAEAYRMIVEALTLLESYDV